MPHLDTDTPTIQADVPHLDHLYCQRAISTTIRQHPLSDTATPTAGRRAALPPLAMVTVQRLSDIDTPTACIDSSHNRTQTLQPYRQMCHTSTQTPSGRQATDTATPTAGNGDCTATIGHRHSHHTGRCATPRPPVLSEGNKYHH